MSDGARQFEASDDLWAMDGLWGIDGSLRDVYVLGTDERDWESFLELVRGLPHEYSFDGQAAGLPSVKALFARRDVVHLLRIPIGSAQAHCHFFVIDELELDLDPREITEPTTHDLVLAFLAGLAERLAKPLLLSPENGPEHPYLTYDPSAHSWMRSSP